MNNLTERKERHSRHTAIVLAVLLHIGLAMALYLQTSAEPGPKANAVPAKEAGKATLPSKDAPLP